MSNVCNIRELPSATQTSNPRDPQCPTYPIARAMAELAGDGIDEYNAATEAEGVVTDDVLDMEIPIGISVDDAVRKKLKFSLFLLLSFFCND